MTGPPHPHKRIIVKRTLLSQKPNPHSLLVAIAGILLMLLISQLCWRDATLQDLLAAVPSRVIEEGEYYRLLSALSVHADIKHFLSNAILFGFFSFLLYGYFGPWIFPVGALVGGAIANYVSLLTYPPHIRLFGASVLVYLMAGFWLTIYLLVERSKPLGRRLLHVVGVGLILLMPTAFEQTVSYRSHLIGFVLGVLFSAVYFAFQRRRLRQYEAVEVEDDFHEIDLGQSFSGADEREPS